MNTFLAKRGSTTLVALIFSIILAALVASAMALVNSEFRSAKRTISRDAAFHVAESGIETAIHAIKNDALDTYSAWVKGSGGYSWTHVKSEFDVGYNKSELNISVEDQLDGSYIITSLGKVANANSFVERAIKVYVELETAEPVSDSVSNPNYNYGIVGRNSISLNHSNPGMLAASYDSKLNGGIPSETNSGYEISLVTPSKNSWSLNLNNSVIHGAVRTGGGNINYSSGDQWNPGQNATIVGVDSGMTSGVDPNMMSTDFDGEVQEVIIPDTSDYITEDYDQNYWQNKGEISIGSWGLDTYITTENFNFNGNDIHVNGNVVMLVNRTINLQGDINIPDGCTLVIMANENIQLNGSTTHSYPSQLEVISLQGRDVVVHSDLWTGTINAPDSTVRLHGTASPVRNSEFRGAVIAGRFEATNGFTFYYDIRLGNGFANKSESGESVRGDVSVQKWLEVAPSSVANLF